MARSGLRGLSARLDRLQASAPALGGVVHVDTSGCCTWRGRRFDSLGEIPVGRGSRGFLVIPAPCSTIEEWETQANAEPLGTKTGGVSHSEVGRIN